MALLGIGHLLERRPATLSGGEARRVAIGRALLADPRLLVLDEPLAGAGRRGKDEILPYLERLHGATGLPMVYVSHALDEVVRLADTLVLLERGRVAAVGPLAAMMPRLGLGGAESEAGAVIATLVAAIDAAHGLATLGFSRRQPRRAGPMGSRRGRRSASMSAPAMSPSPPSGRRASASSTFCRRASRRWRRRVPGRSIVTLDAGGTPLLARITTLSAETLALQPGQAVHALIKSVAFDRRSGDFS